MKRQIAFLKATLFIIILVIFFLIFTGYFFYRQYFSPKTSIDKEEPKIVIEKNDIIGIWQDESFVGAGWADYYQFFDSGKYSFHISQMDCESRDRGNAGFWEIKDNKLILIVFTETKLVGGSLEEPYGSCKTSQAVVGATEMVQSLESKTTSEFILSDNCKNQSPYKCILIGEKEFYQLSKDPSFYGSEFFGEEPVLEESFNWLTYNSDYGFEIKYPSSWERKETTAGAMFSFPSKPPEFFNFEITRYDNSEKMATKDWVQNMLEKNKKQKIGKINYKDSKDLIIGGLPAYELNGVFAYDQYQEWVYVARGSDVFRFVFPVAEENPNIPNIADAVNNNKICHEMLSTVKFVNLEFQDKQQKCINSGGKIFTQTCYCSGTSDFYNNCLVGACTCAPDPEYLRQIKACDCGEGKCFDGETCTNFQN